MTPSVSVVMSVCNGAKFLGPAVESILGQSYRDFEFIIVDDGSTDESFIMLQTYAARDPRIRLISRENRGLAASLNEAVAIARGQWIARMDADDISLPNRLTMQLSWLHETGAAMCGGQVQLIGTQPSRIRKCYISNEAIRLKMLFGSPFVHPAVMLRTDVAIDNPYSEHAPYVEDYELWSRLAMKNIKMTNHPETILQYRVHADQITTVKQKQQRKNMIAIFQEYSRYLLADTELSTEGYLLVADKDRNIDEERFDHAIAFFKDLTRRHEDAEGVISTCIFGFLTRCCGLGAKKVMRQAKIFRLPLAYRLILFVLAATRISPSSKFYRLLYRLR